MKYIKEILPYIIIIVVVVLIRTFIATPVRVTGESMDPTLKDGQILILNKLNNNYKRFDIVVIKYQDEKIIKRIIGLPGDYVSYENNQLYVNDKKVVEDFEHGETADFILEDIVKNTKKIPDNYYLVLGDNRTRSYDSREIGLISKQKIKGKTSIRIYPFNKFGKI